MGPSVSGERGIALKDISGCRACPEDVSTWRKCKRDPVLAVPLSLPTRCVLLGAIPFSRRPRATVPASVLGLLTERWHSLYLYLDLLRLDLGPLGESDPQHATAAFGGGVLGVHRRRHGEGAAERTVVPLDAVVQLALVRLLQLSITAERERVALDLDVHVLCVHLGQLHLKCDPLGVLEDVHLRRPVAGHGDLRLYSAAAEAVRLVEGAEDRKSTRLNSSHGYISYAVFCLKKNNLPRSWRYQPAPS